ncbi:hypothetical protein BH18CHL2_BH18CHL2_01910 [soil metagenome]
MSAERTYVAQNDAERERLRVLVIRSSDDELGRPMPGGWTVAAVLAHAAFWDARAIAYYEEWVRGGTPSAAAHHSEDTDWVNDSVKPLCLALQPRHAALLALRLAEEADRLVGSLSDELLARIQAAGPPPLNLARASHRKEHLDDIERAPGA